MSNHRLFINTLVAASTLLMASMAFAHPKLESSTPANNAEVAAPGKIELHFSENLVKQFSGANLLMSGMKHAGMEMNHSSPMKIQAKVSGSDDPKTMVITPTAPLMPGSYSVEWRAVSSDTHVVTGKINFTVKEGDKE